MFLETVQNVGHCSSGFFSMDFTLTKYASIIDAATRAGLTVYPVVDWHRLVASERRGIMMRHDVDRRPRNALAMAQLEAERGIRSSYYFRIVPSAFDTAVIKEIASLGHEIGYHYEDWYLAGRDPEKARGLFERHLGMIRDIAPVRSIAMHGSPLSSENNMTIWDHFDFSGYDVIDAILSFDYSGYVFFTDAGRTFGQTGANLRDYLGNASSIPSVRNSDQLATYILTSPSCPIQINVHPERWNEPGWDWYRQWTLDVGANVAKRALRKLRK